jgi:hypothetical protein
VLVTEKGRWDGHSTEQVGQNIIIRSPIINFYREPREHWWCRKEPMSSPAVRKGKHLILRVCPLNESRKKNHNGTHEILWIRKNKVSINLWFRSGSSLVNSGPRVGRRHRESCRRECGVWERASDAGKANESSVCDILWWARTDGVRLPQPYLVGVVHTRAGSPLSDLAPSRTNLVG